MTKMLFIKKNEIDKVLALKIDNYRKAEILSAICRVNTLSIIKRAGSGHIGPSFSAMDLFIWIKFFQYKNKKNFLMDSNRNIFFSSKGHDAPALYSVLYALGILNFKKILKLRRLGGLEGHPDIITRGVEANTGSLGMGISKAKGFLWAKNYKKKKGNVVVMIGDGEFQEGQIFEALQTAPHQKLNNLVVIMDHNKIQSSQYVKNIVDLRDLNKKIKSFGWHVARCDGHNFKKLESVFSKFKKVNKKPKFLIADTIKGRGVNFMEHIHVMKKQTFYSWHAGAPNDQDFDEAQNILLKNVNKLFQNVKINIKITDITPKKKENKKTLEIH